MESKKKHTYEHIYKTEVDSWTQKANLCYQRIGGWVNWETEIDVYITTTVYKIDS